MRTECRRYFGVATATGIATHDLRIAFARLSFLFGVLAGMVAFAATEHRHDGAALKLHVFQPV
jgi:hypothetical protein